MTAKPSVLVLADDPRWAWAAKSWSYHRWLSDEFDITVGYRAHYYQPHEIPKWDTFDLIHTFEFPQVDMVPETYRGKLVTGLTAGVWRTWGGARVREWVSRCDAIHANSLLLHEDIKHFHERTVYLPNGIDPEFWHRYRDRPMKRITAAHVGKPKEHKGVPLVGQVCSLAEVPLITCYRTAHNAESPEYVRKVYQDSHVYIVYSSKDGTPCTALEAAACENMIVANHVGNMKEFVQPFIGQPGNNGILIDRTPESLGRALEWCRSNPDDVIAMGKEARKTVLAEWTWEIQCQRVRKFWRETLEGRGGSAATAAVS